MNKADFEDDLKASEEIAQREEEEEETWMDVAWDDYLLLLFNDDERFAFEPIWTSLDPYDTGIRGFLLYNKDSVESETWNPVYGTTDEYARRTPTIFPTVLLMQCWVNHFIKRKE